MIVTGIHRLGFVGMGIWVRGIDQFHEFLRRSSAPSLHSCRSVWNTNRIFRGEEITHGIPWRDRRGCSRDNKLMRGEARPLIGLEHAIAEGVGFGHLEVGREDAGGIVHIGELGIGWRARQWRTWVAAHWDLVSSIHLAAVIHVHE